MAKEAGFFLLGLLGALSIGLVWLRMSESRRQLHQRLSNAERRMAAEAPPSLNRWFPFHRTNALFARFPGLAGPSPEPLAPVKASAAEVQQVKEQRIRAGVPYGGDEAADPLHIGGFLANDTNSYEPIAWKFMKHALGVRSVLDVGCGRGYSTSWFLDNGLRAVCVEGSYAAVRDTLVRPPGRVVQHDFARGPWWPEQTFDAAWSVEVLEHIPYSQLHHVMAAFTRARYLFVSHSIWGGWSHVSHHENWWWIEQFEAAGFSYQHKLTQSLRELITQMGGRERTDSYMRLQGLVFRNENFELLHGEPLLIPTRNNCTAYAHDFCRTWLQKEDGVTI